MNNWDTEYENEGNIPSSNTLQPSSSLREFLSSNKYRLGYTNILDIGCGNGRNLIYAVKSGFEYGTGFDISSKAIEIAKKNIDENLLHDSITVYQNDSLQGIPNRDNTFDLVIDMTTSHLFNELRLKKFFSEMNRVLKPDGYILIFRISKNTDENGNTIDIVETENTSFQYYLTDISPYISQYFKVVEKTEYKSEIEISKRKYLREYERYILQKK